MQTEPQQGILLTSLERKKRILTFLPPKTKLWRLHAPLLPALGRKQTSQKTCPCYLWEGTHTHETNQECCEVAAVKCPCIFYRQMWSRRFKALRYQHGPKRLGTSLWMWDFPHLFNHRMKIRRRSYENFLSNFSEVLMRK